MKSKTILNKEHFKALVCNSCKLCDISYTRAQWCWPKFVENRKPFLTKFVHVVVSSRGQGLSMAYFRRVREFKKLFCDPDTGACLMAFDCQGGMADCFTNYYNQLIGISSYLTEGGYEYGCGWPMTEHDEDAFNEHVIAVRSQHQTRRTVVRRDDVPFIFTSTGKRFLNKVEKILEDRHKPKRRSRKSSTKTSTPAKRKTNTSKSTVLRSTKRRKKTVGDSQANKAAKTDKK